MNPIVVLLSGGMDSAVCLWLAARAGRRIHALSFDYGQRHAAELDAAQALAAQAGAAEHVVARIDLRVFGGSALTDARLAVPEGAAGDGAIPSTYVPARNTIFLAYALAMAEARGAREVSVGVNAVDYSGYPDCRPEYVEAFERLAALATREGVEGRPVRVVAPLLRLSKAQIVALGLSIGVPFEDTRSCYRLTPGGRACGGCAACVLRRDGFRAAGAPDPTRYAAGSAP